MIHQAINLILHMDVHLNALTQFFGPWIYVILFLIIFCETGLMVTPFLPGDSLLFALGALAATENAFLHFSTLLILLIAAGILGDSVNYSIGRMIGPRIFRKEASWWFRKDHLLKTEAFYEKHGGKTIIIARFMPIIRTFAPFVAGIGQMRYGRFILFNITGAIAWVALFLSAGYYFGNIPSVKQNFHYVIFGIILVSCLPALKSLLPLREKVRMRGRDQN